MAPPPPFEAKLVGARALTVSVRELTFERVDGVPMAFEPGQFVSLTLPAAQGEFVKRSYSIASAPDGSSRFELAVTHVEGGPGSTWLHGLTVGTVLRFTGPQGVFTRPAVGSPPSLMIATGTGVGPMRSMIHAALARGSEVPMWLLLGVRHETDILYGDEFAALARRHGHVRFEVTLSQPRDDWTGRRGYVQSHVREMFLALAARVEVPPHGYVCGLERMVRAVRDLLRGELALPRSVVHGERYD
ncbi:MAG: FAD-dependent oxidoreductase [Polyangiaceae bacterium]|jgi:ferredoxin-NADP reductase